MRGGNSKKFYKRLSYYKRRKSRGTPRVPRKTKRGKIYKNSRDHSDLFTDENPKGTVHGLKFKNKEEAKRSIKRLKSLYRSKKISFAHMRQASIAMEQRARHHSHPNKNIKEGMKVWKKFNRSFKKK